MSEQKGSYAHVGLPGLRELFTYVDGIAMKEEKRDLEADLKVLTIIPKDPSEPVNMVHDVVAPHALRRALEAERQLAEKDATIKELQQANAVMKDAIESIWSNSDDDGAIECAGAALDVVKMIGKLKAGDKAKLKDTSVEVTVIDIQYEHDRYQLKDVSGWLYGIHHLAALGKGDEDGN